LTSAEAETASVRPNSMQSTTAGRSRLIILPPFSRVLARVDYR
jgi:hypothetical protein